MILSVAVNIVIAAENGCKAIILSEFGVIDNANLHINQKP